MDEYKFVNPCAPPVCVKAFSLPPAYPDQIQFQPPTLPQNWGDKGAEGKQKLAAQMTAWITMILIIIALLAILYTIFKKCRYVSSLPRVCFPLYPFSTILRGTARMDIFVEVVNLASAEAMWAHFASVAVHPSQLQITGLWERTLPRTPLSFDGSHLNKRGALFYLHDAALELTNTLLHI